MYCARAGRCVRVLEAEITVRVPRQKRSSKGVHRARPQSATSQAAEQEAMRVAAVTNAREVAVAVAADAEADALERATADGGSSGAARPSEASEAEVPSEFMCSITAEIMTDPVNTVCRTALALGNGWACSCTFAHCLHPPYRERGQMDGHTYERSAIEQWLENHNTSPETGLELDSKQLIPCHRLRSLIREFHEGGRR